jgi:hypothetical protein
MALANSFIAVSLFEALSDVIHPTYTSKVNAWLNSRLNTHLIMNAIPVYCLDKNAADILAAMVTFDAGEIKLLILKLPLQWLVRGTPNVMACDRKKRLSDNRGP